MTVEVAAAGAAPHLPSRVLRLGRRALVGGEQLDAVVLGRALLVVTGALVVLTAPLLGVSERDVTPLAVVSLAMVAIAVSTFLPPWSQLPRWSLVFFPAATFAAFTFLGLTRPMSFAPATGFLTLSFVYLGLTQPAGVAVSLVPAGLFSYMLNYAEITGPILVRSLVAASVWLIVATLLAKLTANNAAAAAALQQAATSDSLTGVPNRRGLDARLTSLTAYTVLVVCDIDHFKRINDTLGHAAGDVVLAGFGSVLRSALRDDDFCARLGGEEFVLVLPGCEPGGQQHVIDRVRELWTSLQPTVTFSTGSAVHRRDRAPEATLQAADRALYAAKEGGRNTDRFEPLVPASAKQTIDALAGPV